MIDYLKLYIINGGNPSVSMMIDVDNSAKKTITYTLDNYPSAMSNIDNAIRSLDTTKIYKNKDTIQYTTWYTVYL